MFAIVDIETTGGSADGSGITEIAIYHHNGISIQAEFHSLINPGHPIPKYITALTGITDAMVAGAPSFAELVPTLLPWLENRVFVAHNVNFDYSFIKAAFDHCSIDWQAQKLCTVRYARQVVKGLPSYSLGNLCRHFSIQNTARHRAGGDAAATGILFEKLFMLDEQQRILKTMLKRGQEDAYAPMHLPAEVMRGLPYQPGVYYFKNKQGNVLYVGKAKNIKFRVRSHFSNNQLSKRKQDWLREVADIEYKVCVSELHALVWEELEIKRLWPPYNAAQKRPQALFGIYSFYDQRGFLRLAVQRKKKLLRPIVCLPKASDCFSWARKVLRAETVDERLLFASGQYAEKYSEAEVQLHNNRLSDALQLLKTELPEFLFWERGLDAAGKNAQVFYVIQQGSFTGLYETNEAIVPDLEAITGLMTPYKDNDYIKYRIYQAAQQNPDYMVGKL